MDIRNFADPAQRRIFIEKETGQSLPTVGSSLYDDVSSIHCENLIGGVTIPLGVAGPLDIKGVHITQNVLIPLATTEGALIASVSRGCKAINQAGGAIVRTKHIGVTRGSVFQTHGIDEGMKANVWIDTHIELLQQEASQTSSHLKLIKTDMQLNGTELYVRFYYDTDEAMGMNMATIATDKLVRVIEKECGLSCIAVAGNYDIDKKAAWLNSIEGRGRRGWAEVTLPTDIVNSILKTTPEKIVEVVRSKCWGGSMISGSLGFNAHFANMVAAFFAATGQDLAHVVEGSQGITSARLLSSGELYFAISMPAIMLGVVGGGTKLKAQTEARSLTKAKSAIELAEILLGAVLAGELSLIASISEQSLSDAHKSLGR